MEYNFSGLRKAAAPQGAAAFNFSGLRRADDQQQDDQQPSTADIFAIGDASKKVTPPQPERFNVMDEARRASQVLRNIGRRMVSPVKRIGEGVADVMTGGGIYPQRAMAGAVPQPRTADGDLVAEGLKKMATGAADVGITATMPGTTLAGSALEEAYNLPEGSPAESAAHGIASGIKAAKEAAQMFASGEGMQTPLPGGGMAPTGAILRGGRGAMDAYFGAMTARHPFLNLLSRANPLIEENETARTAMAPVSEYGWLKPSLESKRFQTKEEKDLEAIADLAVPSLGEKALRSAGRGIADRFKKIRESVNNTEEARQMREGQPPAAAEPQPLNFDGLRRAEEPVKPKQPMPADPVSTMPVPPMEDKVVLPNADRAARRTLTRADYAKADAGEFPVLSAIGKDRITPDLVPDRRTGKMVERGEYADTPNVFKAGKGESGISLASAVERYNEMLPEEAHITDTEFLERLNDEIARFEKRHRVQAKMADAVIPKSKYIDLNRLGEEDRAQLLDTVEGIVPYMQVKYADLDDSAALKAMKDIRAGKTGTRAAQLLLHEASDAIAMDGLGITHEGQDAFIPLEDLRRMGVDAREEAKNPQPKKRNIAEEAAPFIAAAAGVGIAGAQLLLGKDEDKEKAGTALAGIAMMGAVGRMNPKTRDTFNAMQRHVQGRFALGEIRSGELGTALRDVVKEYLEKGDGRFIPKDERALLLQASGSWNAKQQAREAGKNFKLQNEIMRFARSIEPTFSDLTDSAGEATSSKRSIVEAGWVTRGIWENIKDRVTDEINNNRQYAHLGAEGKRELFRTVEKNYEYLIERSNEAIWNGQLGMGGADRAAAIAPDTYTGYEDLSRLRVNMSDADRNFEAFFGKDYERAKKAFLDPLDKSKEAHADLQKRYLDDLTDKVVKKFGIRRYSRADAAVQNYGEGYRSVEAEIPLEVLTVNRDEVLSRAAGPDGAPKKFIPSGDYKENTAAIKAEKLKAWVKEQYGEGAEPGELTGGRKMQVKVPYTEADLVREFGKPRAEEIKAAEAWFRKSYDDLLAKVNMVRAKIYPGNPDKIIRRRRDYFRHYQEIADQLGGLLNIFESPGLGLIDSRLSGISAETAPKSKWASFMQRRSGTRTTESAIGGFLNYLPNASYAINIDPHISRLRGLRETIAEGTEKTKNANNFVEWLHDYANNLSGKTSDADRALMKLIGRGNMRALNSLNSRVKSNTVLGNISSALMQLGNVPQGIASAKMHSIPGLVDTFVDLLNGSPNSSKSGFIKTRYEGNMYEPFDVRIMDQPKKFAKFMLEALDQVGTRFIWNSHYRKAIAEGMQEAEAIRWADNKTRRMVGGRGIGEVPILQGSKVMQLIAPFQLEVGNLLWNVRDFAQQKDYTALVTLAAATYLFNQAKEKTVGGDGVLLDPIQALIDAVHIIAEEDDKTKGAMKGTGRMVGELLSNMPFGQTAADVYPEYGAQDIFGTGFDLPTRKEFFGRTDPNRFGGGLLSIKALSDPLFKVLPPWGGSQAKKTKAAIDAIRQHGVYNRAGEYQYDVDNEKTRALMFGPSGTNAAREYHDNK